MTTKTNSKGTRMLLKAAPVAMLLLYGNQLLAQTAPDKAQEGTSMLEILGYVAMIIGVILLAWFIGSAQSKSDSHEPVSKLQQHRHFEHPNDPHFRKLKKKTS